MSTQNRDWLLLFLLSIIWGGSFLFIGIAVKELPALLIVLARVAIAAAVILPFHLLLQGPLPMRRKTWIACAGMSILNNVIPFTAISWGQHYITTGLASVINAMTPMFAVLFMAMFAMEALTMRRVVGVLVGILGVIVLKGSNLGNLGPQTLGILAVLLAATCYGASSPWSKKMLAGIPPLTIATLQLMISTAIMLPIAFTFSEPQKYFEASRETWIAIILLAAVSTSIAYLLFFRILATSGPTFLSLVTMLIPVSAILMGYLWLGDRLTLNELIGAVIIGIALVIIDGRATRLLSARFTKNTAA